MDNHRTMKDDLYELHTILKKLYYWPIILPFVTALVTNLQSTDTKKVDKYQYDTTMWSTTDKSLIDTLQTYRN